MSKLEKVCPKLEKVCPKLEKVCPKLEKMCPKLEKMCPKIIFFARKYVNHTLKGAGIKPDKVEDCSNVYFVFVVLNFC